MKITPPRIAKVLKEDADLTDKLSRKGEDLTEYAFKNVRIIELTANNVSVQSCQFTNCLFTACNLKKSQFSDILFRNCDLSNLNFSGSGFHRVEFIDCKLTGTNFADSVFNHILFSKCKADYINLTDTRQKYVYYQESDIRNGSFEHCQFTSVEFDSCNLTEAEFNRTLLKGIDLTNSNITGIRVNPATGELRGAVVSSLQALELAHLMGLTIKG